MASQLNGWRVGSRSLVGAAVALWVAAAPAASAASPSFVASAASPSFAASAASRSSAASAASRSSSASAADCEAAGHAWPLTGLPTQEPAHAQAVWLDGRLLRWAGAEAAAAALPSAGAAPVQWRLHHAARGGLQLNPGEAVRGADGALRLSLEPGPLPPGLEPRFRYLGAGAQLALAPADAARLPQLLQGQLLLTREDAQGRVLAATRTQHAPALDALYARADQLTDLGAVITGHGRPGARTGFRVWAPTAQRVSLCLYGDQPGQRTQVLPMQRDPASGSWHAQQRGSLHGRRYTYLVDVMVPGQGLVRNRVTDPYALTLTPNSQHAVAVDLNAPDTQPPGWNRTPRPQTVKAPTDLTIYELHVRDFSVTDPSVPAAERGRYGAFALNDTHGVRHLRALAAAGLTDVHLLPVFDLATVPEIGCSTPTIPQAAPDSEAQQAEAGRHRASDCFNWGYDPLHFTAPEGSFATPGASGLQRLVEFRRMVQALHTMGLRVGMDVVYNHTSASGQHAQSVFDRIVPGYYHRLNAQGEVERSTCCDNTATEHRMMAKLMIESAVVWARDHRIDSFRFDLMGHQPREAMERLQKAVDRAAGQPIHLIGEGWNFGEVADGLRFVQASQLSLNGSGIGTFNDRLRDAVRGGGHMDNGEMQFVHQGYVSGLHFNRNAVAEARNQSTREQLLRMTDLIRAGLAGSIRSYVIEDHRGERVPLERIPYGNQPAGYVTQPGEVVNYVENHDNPTLFDALVFKLPDSTSREDRARVQTLASAINLLAQGIAYVHAGQELLRSKSLDRNSYDSGDWFNRIDWTAQDNHFGTGLPPREDNLANWPVMKPLLARAAEFKPRPADIAFTRDAFLDLLRIRSSTTLLRLRTADDIRQRLRFFNTGPQQNPVLLAGYVDGRGYAGAGFAELLYLVNVDAREQTLQLPELAGRALQLHPVHLSPQAADTRPAQLARFERETGRFVVPARTALVYVLK
ncbi:MAG: pullulanase-type alpha-1,6-glucosidase [Rubrivivax sp.]|nr:pullulanase-type alpha-1,6-glucosidase [Rubrivivax sp.]